MAQRPLLIYGSYGYTGNLIVEACRDKGWPVLLAGRDDKRLRAQSERSGYPYLPFTLDQKDTLQQALSMACLVIHCAGPFRYTATTLATACLKAKVHYLDITGEFEVFEQLASLDEAAREAGITVMPGTGFDVVPSDCLAVYLKHKLPDATHLELGFTSLKGGVSRGTALTMVEGLGEGSYIREAGRLKNIGLGTRYRTIVFEKFTTTAVAIPWGDITSAYQSTGIPNITVFMGMPEKTIRRLRMSIYINWLLKKRWIKSWLRKKVNQRPAGPSDERRQQGRSFLWGQVRNARGEQHAAWLDTYDGYTLTAKTATLIAGKILAGDIKSGYHTPAMAYGPDLILEVAGTHRTDVI